MTSAKQVYLGVRRGTPTPPLPYDAEVEYLESTGTQYIDLSQHIDGRSISATMKWLPMTNMNDRFIHGGGQNSSPVVRMGVYSNHNPFVAADGSQCNIFVGNSSLVSMVDRQYIVSKTNLYYSNYVYLFCQEWFGRPNGLISARLFYAVFIGSDNEELLDLIPVRFTNSNGQSEGAMYDRVSGQLFRNAGTGAFRFGTDIAGGGYKWLGYSPLRFSRSTRLWKEAA